MLAGGAAWLHIAGPIVPADPAAPQSAEPMPAESAEAEAIPPPPTATPAGTETAESGTAESETAESGAAGSGAAGSGSTDSAATQPAPDAPSEDMPPALPEAGAEAGMAGSAPPADGGDAAAAAESPAPEPQPQALPPVDPLWLARSQAPLPEAPDPRLQEEGVDGTVPRPGPDGEQPWQVYARPFEPEDEDRPRIAIVFGGLGMDSPATVRAIEALPGEASLVMSPYARNLQDWIAQARGKGHEVLLSLPVQPPGYPANDPGPHALLSGLGPAEQAARLRWTLARGGGYVGLAAESASPVTENAENVAPLLSRLKEHGLLFLDAGAGSAVTAAAAAEAAELPFAAADLQLDAIPAPAAIDRALAELERLARENGQAVGYALPYPVSIDRVAAWAQSLEAKGFALAPLTGIIRAAGSG